MRKIVPQIVERYLLDKLPFMGLSSSWGRVPYLGRSYRIVG
jgi:hypothetical protein